MPGESIGIIGKNGAGKSTLLKVLSRITPPTKGHAIIRGRLASLLEVGTGFHPELTGKENIFLNGSVLGLKRREIRCQFDAIVDFSGVERFLDTPLKFYSSGMQLRLAFAVAAFLEPEILLLDEVLAVGDAEFQKKGLQKMDEVAKSGKTVIFISHNMAAVRQLCTKGILLEKGKLSFIGTSDATIDQYINKVKKSTNAVWENDVDIEPKFFLKRIEIKNSIGELTTNFLNSEKILIYFYTQAFTKISNLSVGFDLSKDGIIVLRTRQTDCIKKSNVEKNEIGVYVCDIPAWFLNTGTYIIRPNVSIYFTEYLSKAYQLVELPFEVKIDPSRSIFHQNLDETNQPGVIFPTLNWDIISNTKIDNP